MNECHQAVTEYLRHAGAAELGPMRRDTGRKWTEAQLRAALKKCGAVAYKSVNTFYPQVRNWNGGSYIETKKTCRGFTIYRIPQK